jgi:hypothetical protein
MTTKKLLALREWRYPRTYRTIFAREPRSIFQADVMELHPLWKHIFHQFEIYTKYRPKDYALVCIDVFSWYVWSAAMDKQDTASTAVAMIKIFYHMGIPKILQGDKKLLTTSKRNCLHMSLTGVDRDSVLWQRSFSLFFELWTS